MAGGGEDDQETVQLQTTLSDQWTQETLSARVGIPNGTRVATVALGRGRGTKSGLIWYLFLRHCGIGKDLLVGQLGMEELGAMCVYYEKQCRE